MNSPVEHRDAYGKPVGAPIGRWTPPAEPPRSPMVGHHVELVATDADAHAGALYGAFTEAADWTYLPHGPFDDIGAFTGWLQAVSSDDGLVFHTILRGDVPVGVASYLRIAPSVGSIEVGYLHFSPALQRTPAATEAMFLMMQRAFDLGYRRYEWKCDSLNAPSRRAAERLGFSFEGVFRNATIYKQRNRDTAWFSIIDTEWPHLRAEFERWLDPSNFDADGTQRTPLDTRPS